jgi:hypothetical protein
METPNLKLQVTRIPPPDSAGSGDISFGQIRLSEYRAIQAHRDQMLAAVHREVEEYLNTPGFSTEGDEGSFPNRSEMSGEYYIGEENYTRHVGPLWFQIGVLCRCLRKPTWADRDYLGLQVWLRCDPENWVFSTFRNTDSSVI